MKRATFVFIGIMAITASVLLTQNKTKKESASIIKVDMKKHSMSGIYD